MINQVNQALVRHLKRGYCGNVIAIRKLVALVVLLSHANLAWGGEAVQTLDIPHRMPKEGRLPSFEVLVDGARAGVVYSDAILSSGRFFGLRWIARADDGWRMRINEGTPHTLQVWHGGRIELVEIK